MDRELVSAGTLYVVATPLGNLGDLSPRAAEVLAEVAVVAAEDTRRTRTLLSHLGVRSTLISVHAHVSESRTGQVLDVLREGKDVALVTDAGTPGVSDPGPDVVTRALDEGIPVRTVPGPSAVAAAVSVSGLSADRFTFLGFPPRAGRARRELLDAVAVTPWTTVLFEAPTRTAGTLRDLAVACGADRRAVVARELTKVHEEVRPGTLETLAGYYAEHPPRGEVTIVVAAGTPRPAAPRRDPEELARELVARGLSRRDAAQRVAEETGVSRNVAYKIVSAL